jgi:endoglucanase
MFIVNNLALAYDFTGQAQYLNGAAEAMNYVLGRNSLAKSYVSGYGENALQNPHHLFWAKQKDASYPAPPPGAMSGSPNPGLQDPVASAALAGCKPQKCYLDNIDSRSTNEITINWNAPFAWLAAYLDEKSGAIPPTPPPPTTPPPTTPAPGCDTTNAALNKPIISSSNETTSLTSNLAVAGNAGTRWASAFSDPQWLRVDLGQTMTICRVKPNWEAAYGKSYQIQVSNDGTNFTSIYTTTTGNGGIDV